MTLPNGGQRDENNPNRRVAKNYDMRYPQPAYVRPGVPNNTEAGEGSDDEKVEQGRLFDLEMSKRISAGLGLGPKTKRG